MRDDRGGGHGECGMKRKLCLIPLCDAVLRVMSAFPSALVLDAAQRGYAGRPPHNKTTDDSSSTTTSTTRSLCECQEYQQDN